MTRPNTPKANNGQMRFEVGGPRYRKILLWQPVHMLLMANIQLILRMLRLLYKYFKT